MIHGTQAELQTERKRVVLFDNSASPLPVLTANGRHDFTVEHELKEIGAHTLVCSTVYTDADQERKYLPQYFKFTVANPLAVRTKVCLEGVKRGSGGGLFFFFFFLAAFST
jgi:hypothetical protein